MEHITTFDTDGTEMVTLPRAEYDALQAGYTELNKQLDYLMEQLRLSKKKLYGASSEKTSEEVMEQLGLLFNEAEVYAAKEEADMTTVAAHTRKKKSASVVETLPEDVRVEVVEHDVPEAEQICPECGTRMERIGQEVRRTLVLKPAEAYIREDVFYTYACKRCNTEDIETPVVKAEKVPAVLPGSYASPEAIAHIMTQKFVMGSPLYRQEKEWNRAGIMLSRQTMSNWILQAAELWLKPVYDHLHHLLIQRDILHADETTLQVLKEPGKSSQTKSYMWLYRTGTDAAFHIILYDYRPDRKPVNAENFLRGFSGWLHADGYQGYHALPENIVIVGCWAHLRRKFDEAVKSLSKENQKNAAALQGQAFCNKLFDLEKEFSKLKPEKRYEERLKRSKPVADALLAWADSISAAPKSRLGIALTYLHNQWPYLIRFLEDGRLELSNNLAERSIKPFAVDRKNFLFANTPRGAQGSGIIFSLIETARANGLDPYRYLVWLMTKAPVLSTQFEDWPALLSPDRAPSSCHVPTPEI